eukprot:372234_1
MGFCAKLIIPILVTITHVSKAYNCVGDKRDDSSHCIWKTPEPCKGCCPQMSWPDCSTIGRKTDRAYEYEKCEIEAFTKGTKGSPIPKQQGRKITTDLECANVNGCGGGMEYFNGDCNGGFATSARKHKTCQLRGGKQCSDQPEWDRVGLLETKTYKWKDLETPPKECSDGTVKYILCQKSISKIVKKSGAVYFNNETSYNSFAILMISIVMMVFIMIACIIIMVISFLFGALTSYSCSGVQSKQYNIV